MNEHVSVAIIGAGPSGLTAAAALSRVVDGEVRVFDREAQAGGIPRHSDHPGYGIRDLRRFISGPAYARRLDGSARAAGAIIETEAMVTGWSGERQFDVTSPRGRRTVTADAVVLATGARERPRSARRIPGDRPRGVYTTGQLQNLVHLYHRKDLGSRAVIVGAELVSWSAAMTLKEAGCRPALMTTQYAKAEAYALFRLLGPRVFGVEVSPRTKIVAINGRPRVESVELENLDTGERRTVPCDIVITTGDWIPDHELARSAGIELDSATRGPRVDARLATSAPGIFAIGNLVHPVDTADVAALDGAHVAGAVQEWLANGVERSTGPAIVADSPLRWVAPQVLTDGAAPARGRLLLWADVSIALPRVTAIQDGRTIGARRLPWPCEPGRVFRVPAGILDRADHSGGAIHLRVS